MLSDVSNLRPTNAIGTSHVLRHTHGFRHFVMKGISTSRMYPKAKEVGMKSIQPNPVH